jgi:tetratricopeptide (TPR) repeat protein
MTTLRVFLAFLAFALAFPFPGYADDKASARAHYETAARLYDVGEYDRALVEFKEAYVAKPDPAFLFNIGQCYRKLGQEEQALDFFRRFLKRAAPDDPNRAQVEARLRDTETDAVFKGDLQRAEEREEAETPPPAEPTVAATPAPVVVELPTPPAPPLPRRTPVFVKRAAPVIPATEASHPGRSLRIAGIVTGAVGVASIGTAIYFYSRARAYSDIVSNYRNHTVAAEQAGRDCETAQWVLYPVGAAALATGAVLYWLGWDVKPVVAPGLAGIAAGGTF